MYLYLKFSNIIVMTRKNHAPSYNFYLIAFISQIRCDLDSNKI